MTNSASAPPGSRSLKVAGLFAGIGGIELGLNAGGHETELLCEIEPWAQATLERGFVDVPIHDDITTLDSLPKVDLVTAGFPCQDLSLAGTRAGLDGSRSGLVSEVFRLIERSGPELVMLENVLHLLRLGSGSHFDAIVDRLERLGYRWAYRVVDSRGFGLPQRRFRVIVVASRGETDPSSVLFSNSVQADVDDTIQLEPGRSYGFYWTEGKRGVGWARDAVPPIKGGSGLGIPSPPAVFDTATMTAGTPTIEDAERLQGFEPGWTDVVIDGKSAKPGARWKMVGNAVSAPLGHWIGEALAREQNRLTLNDLEHRPLDRRRAWPMAAASIGGERFRVEISPHVEVSSHVPILEFLDDPLKPLSEKALRGYIRRARTGRKKYPPGFLESLEVQAGALHIRRRVSAG